MTEETTPLKSRHRKLIIRLALISCFMFGFGYALVPLYNVLFNTLGINGKTGGQVIYTETPAKIDQARTIRVEFLATNNASLPWQFYPEQKIVYVHPGASTKVTYFAENDSSKPMTVQAIPSVSPGIAAKYLKKTECFCFRQQHLDSHISKSMPIIFHLDPKLPKDISTVTLSYTLFDVTDRQMKPHKNEGKIG